MKNIIKPNYLQLLLAKKLDKIVYMLLKQWEVSKQKSRDLLYLLQCYVKVFKEV